MSAFIASERWCICARIAILALVRQRAAHKCCGIGKHAWAVFALCERAPIATCGLVVGGLAHPLRHRDGLSRHGDRHARRVRHIGPMHVECVAHPAAPGKRAIALGGASQTASPRRIFTRRTRTPRELEPSQGLQRQGSSGGIIRCHPRDMA